MHWLLAVVGAFFGAMLGGIHEVMLGLVAGALLGWQGTRISQLRQRIAALERQAALDSGRAARQTARSRAQDDPASAHAVTGTAAETAPAVATPATGASGADTTKGHTYTSTESPAAAALAATAPAAAVSADSAAHAAITAASQIQLPPPRPRQCSTGTSRRLRLRPSLACWRAVWLFSGNAGQDRCAALFGWLPLEVFG